LFVLDRLQSEAAKLRTFSDELPKEDEWTEIGSKSRRRVIASQVEMEQTPISQMFAMRIRACLSVQSRTTESLAVQPAFTLPLTLNCVKTVDQALEQFFAPQSIEGYRGRREQHAVKALQSHTLDASNLPEILVLHLKRFDVGMIYNRAHVEKMENHILFSDVLTLHKHYLSNNMSNKSITYSLSSVIVHHGCQVKSGHYTCFVKRTRKSSSTQQQSLLEWYHLDDTKVTKVSPSQVFHQKAYLLFYTKN